MNEAFEGYFDCDSRWWDAIDACEAAGVVVLFAAGNEGPDPQSMRSPGDRATSPFNAFSIGSTPQNHLSPSAFSPVAVPRAPTAAPSRTASSRRSWPRAPTSIQSLPGGEYGYLSGTSMATPHVAGVVALMRSANPDLDVITIKQVLMDTSPRLGTPGRRQHYGHGFVDAYAAVMAVITGYGYIDGTIVDAGTGLPVEGAQVSVVDGIQTAVTNASGQFQLSIPQGQIELAVSCFGYLDGLFSVTITEDQTLVETFALDLAPVVSLSGRVFDPEGLPAAGAVVQALDIPTEPVTSGADGSYELQLPIGALYDVQAELALVGRVIETVDFQGPSTLDLILLPMGAYSDLSPLQFEEVLNTG